MMFTSAEWDEVAKDLSMGSNKDAEEIVHELVHAYDCIGTKAFVRVGSENEVNRLIQAAYPETREQDAAEVRAAAVTLLVLSHLDVGHISTLRQEVLNNLHMNLKGVDIDLMAAEERLDAAVASLSVQSTAKTIESFLFGFLLEVRSEFEQDKGTWY